MAIQSQPSRISEPFAGSGTKNSIPATNATPSASQAASWASGFPPECSQPISAGGCPVPRNDVNGVLNQISQDYAFRQDGGVWEWSALADYDVGRIVRGSDGLLYRSKAQSGVSIVVGAQDPTADNGTYWTAVPLDNADVVHKSGSETITGAKTFASSVDFAGNGHNFASDIVIATPNFKAVDGYIPYSQFASLQFVDKAGYLTADGTQLGRIEVETPAPDNGYVSELVIGTRTFAVGSDTYPVSVAKICSYKSGNHIFHLGSIAGVEAITPQLRFFNQGAPTKGTWDSSNHYSTISFSDSHGIDDELSTGSGLYGQIASLVNSSGGTVVYLDTRKNEANSSSYTRVMLQYAADDTCEFRPWSNNQINLGSNSIRWKNVYTNASAINGSDERIKDSIDSIPDAVLDAWGDVGFVQFRMKDSVKEKGASARLHSGLIAQSIEAAFTEHGLNAADYGLFCHDSWNADPSMDIEAGDLYSLRYEEALCMEAAYQRRRADRAEARIAALEERLAAIEAKLG